MGFHYIKERNKTEAISSNKWTMGQTFGMKLFGMGIDKNSFQNEAFIALLTKKLEDEELKGRLRVRLYSEKIPINSVKYLTARISNGTIWYVDSLEIIDTKGGDGNGNNYAVCELKFDYKKMKAKKGRGIGNGKDPEAFLQFLQDLYTQQHLKVTINPTIGNESAGWAEVSVKQAEE